MSEHRETLHSQTALKLHAFGITCLHDPNWTGANLFDELKQHTRGRRDPTDLLRRPLDRGLAFHLGDWLFRKYVLNEERFAETVGEYGVCFLEDLLDFLDFHHVPESAPARSIARFVRHVDALYERDETKFFDHLDAQQTCDEISETYQTLLDTGGERIAALVPKYATDFAERVLHDRQLCAHIARTVVSIGFDGDDDDTGQPQQWCERAPVPRWVGRVLLARERGKCGACGTDLASELTADPHIDHMVPLSKGGCNDIVNLQVLCDSCNLQKGNRERDVVSSVPRYFARRSQRRKADRK